MKKMKIAVIAPIFLPIPPKKYGGTERVVHELVEGLVKEGHDVTLYATGDSQTSATLKSFFKTEQKDSFSMIRHLSLSLRDVYETGDFDLVHNHIQNLALMTDAYAGLKALTTLHLDLPLVYKEPEFNNEHHKFCAISHDQAKRSNEAGINIDYVVYNGLDFPDLPTKKADFKGEYLAFLGSVRACKGTHHAIEAAIKAGYLLKIAGTLMEKEYFLEKIYPFIESGQVEYVGELNDQEKFDFLVRSQGMLFPISWHEPFGLVVLESLACGTPVIAFDNGSPSELIEDGISGFLVQDVEQMVERIKYLPELSSADCQQRAKKFLSAAMVEGYLQVYQDLLRGN